MNESEIEIRRVDPLTAVMTEQIGRLRVTSWATEIPEAASMTSWIDSFDAYSLHWAAFHANSIVAAARLSIHQSIEDVPEPEVYTGVFKMELPLPIGSINRLVVAPPFRRRGLGRTLDLARLQAAIAYGCGCVVGETPSGEHRVRQLENIGFIRAGAGAGAPYSGPNFYANCSSEVLLYICDKPTDSENRRTRRL